SGLRGVQLDVQLPGAERRQPVHAGHVGNERLSAGDGPEDGRGAWFGGGGFRARAGKGDRAGVLVLAAGVQWRSRSHRENRADQPVGSAANGDRNHGAGSAVSAIAGGGQRTELRRKRDGGFLGPSRAEPKRAERALLEHGGAASRPRNAAARAAGVDPAGRQRSAGGEGL